MKYTKRTMVRLILNTFSFAFVIAINYLSNTNTFGEKSVGDISRQYETLITPAGYAFSIWGLIYLMLIFFLGYQWYSNYKKIYPGLLQKIGWWFTIANVANALWVIVWVNDRIGLSLVIILVLLSALVQLVKRLDLEMWDAPFSVIFFVWWPITIYLGWAILATVLNVTVFFVSAGWSGAPFSPGIWAVTMIVASALIYIILTFTRNLREAAVVGVWGLIAIAYNQTSHHTVSTVAVIAAIVLLVSTSIHAYRNRKYSILKKMR